MATSTRNSFERVLPRRELTQGAARGVAVWSGLGSLLLCLLLLDLFLIGDLLEHRGRIEVTPESVEAYERLSAEQLVVGDRAGPPPVMRFENRGILPAAWWSRDRFWGPAFAALYRWFPLLRYNNGALIVLVIAGFAIGVVRSLAMGHARTLSARVAAQATTRLRQTLHRQSLRLGPSDLGREQGETALGLFTRDVERVERAVEAWVSRLGRHPLELALLVAFVVSIHWRVALQCVVPLAFCWYMLKRQRERQESARQLAAARIDGELRLLAESFRKTRLVRGFGMENFEHELFQKHLARFNQNVSAAQTGQRWSQWAGRLLILFCVCVVLYLLAVKALLPADDAGSLTLAAALVLVAAFAAMYRPLDMLWTLPESRHEAAEAADRIYRYLDQIPEVGQAVGAKFLQPLAKSLQFESVSYTLPNRRPLLDRCDLKLSAGGTYALVAPNSLESRTLAYLLPRFIEPKEGRILFDGEDIAWVTLESLRAEVIYVGGDAYFTGTVRENLSCGNTRYSLQDITDAAKLTHAHNFIVKFAQGYDTVLGEHGEQLDPGESFRLGLARAVLRKPALLIVEEPDVRLDDDTKSLLDDAYNRLIEGRTVLFIPSRLSTLKRADCIVLLHNGKVEAMGGHNELIKKVPLYRHWEYVRYNEFRRTLEA